ncbi:MAG: hypothetical protein KME22_01545 [Hassallia sp. WJT32-NPBG1]|jgi:hypothetical protein|nr:hypothetical protein [Hassallia sp. WJT32-NPBG1]
MAFACICLTRTQVLIASNGSNKKTQLTFAGGIGDRQAPLLEMTTDITGSSTTFKSLCQRLGVSNTTGKCE